MPTTNPLVDQTLIASAAAQYDTLVAKLVTANTAVTTAGQAYTAAQAALLTAAQGGNSQAALDAAKAEEDADRARRVATMVAQAANDAVNTAKDAQRVAVGKAWRPVYLDGARRRLAAAQAGDTARAALAAAEQAYADGTAALAEAVNHGTTGVQAVDEGSPRLRTAAEESSLWMSHRFDPVAGTYLGQWDN